MPNEDLGDLLEPAPLLEALTRHGVDFVLIGGLAGLVHGSAYPTFDLDIAYARDVANLERLARALDEIGVILRGAPADLPFQTDVRTLANGSNFTFDSRFGKFDIFGDVAGVGAYDDLRRQARIEEVAGFEIRVASLDHLIAMKRAANRTKDKLMVEEYIAIADLARREEEQGRSD